MSIPNNGFKAGNIPWNKGKSKKTTAQMAAAGYVYKGKWVKIPTAKLNKEKREFSAAMEKAEGVIVLAAKFLGITRRTFYKAILRWPDIRWKDRSVWISETTPKERLTTKEKLIKALDETEGYRGKAAVILGLKQKAFEKLLKAYPEVNWDALYPKRRRNNSQIFDTKVFDVARIFFVYYTHVLELGTEIRMATTVWARSSEEAKNLVRTKVMQDNKWHAAKSLRTYVAHSSFKKGMGALEWVSVRYLAYPNKWDRLTRIEL
jgi:DNA-binding protein Fis